MLCLLIGVCGYTITVISEGDRRMEFYYQGTVEFYKELWYLFGAIEEPVE
jgi:hypothetical protein